MKAKMMLYGLEETIDNNLDIILSNDLKRVLGIDESVYTVYNAENHDFLAGKSLNGVDNVNTIRTEYIHIESEEESEDNSGTMLHPERYTGYDIFSDHSIGVKVGSLKYKKKRSTRFTFYSQSKTKVNSIVEKLRTFDIYNYGKKKHKLEYHFDLPPSLLQFLDHVRTLKNKRLETNEQLDLPDYINKHSMHHISRKNISSELPYKFTLSVREHVYDVDGMMVTDTYNITKETVDKLNYYKFSIEYDIWYAKPVMLLIDFPVMIYNTPIDARYTNVLARPEVRNPIQGQPDPMYKGLYELAKPYSRMKGIRYHNVVNIPAVDDFDNYPTDRTYQNVCSLLIIVDDNNPYAVMNIKKLPNFQIRETFLKYLLKHPDSIKKQFNGLFHFMLYKDGSPDYKNPINMDNQGNITTEFPMEIKSTYRIILRILKNLDYMSEEAMRELNAYALAEVKSLVDLKDDGTFTYKDAVTKNNPHIKEKLYYVDEYGNILDDEGYLVYTDGTRITTLQNCECLCNDDVTNTGEIIEGNGKRYDELHKDDKNENSSNHGHSHGNQGSNQSGPGHSGSGSNNDNNNTNENPEDTPYVPEEGGVRPPWTIGSGNTTPVDPDEVEDNTTTPDTPPTPPVPINGVPYIEKFRVILDYAATNARPTPFSIIFKEPDDSEPDETIAT